MAMVRKERFSTPWPTGRAVCKRFAMPADPEIGLSSEWAIGLSACRVIELSGHWVVELLDAKMYGELVVWMPWKCKEGLDIL